MQLASYPSRLAIGIDSYQRGILYSALLLRKAYSESSDNAIKDTVQIAINLTNSGATVVIRATIQFSGSALTTGGDILSNILEPLLGSVAYEGNTITTSAVSNITEEPAIVDSLEQYFYWCCQQYLLLDTANYKAIAIQPIFKGSRSAIDCIVSIPINYGEYLRSNNLIQAIGIAETQPPITVTGGQLTNDLQLTNEVQLTNV